MLRDLNVIEHLNRQLTNELTAVNQYFLHAHTIGTLGCDEYHGTFVNFGPMIANPKPVQKPHPPVIVGGAYPYAARRAVQYGDGWYALTGTRYGDEFAFIPKFQDMLANAGRNRSSCPITICLYPEELDAFAPHQVPALARYEELGVARCIVGLNAEKREDILPLLDRWAGFMRNIARSTRPIRNAPAVFLAWRPQRARRTDRRHRY
jgi:alkanesulfonate monooxygenase SsuD/methylene tetrahydromethanopterin reductase-like flavin-dependent oxidoreductase (luciferase family)